jgi:hypothetical protein
LKTERVDAGPARRILTAMVVNDAVAGRVVPQWRDGGLFAGKWENLIGGWVVKYSKKYGRAPGREIESMFARWAADAKDPATVELVESFLSVLSAEYEKSAPESTDYIIDAAAAHFNRVRLGKLADEIRADLADGADARAEERLNKYGRVELGVGAGIDVTRDKNALAAALADADEDLVKYDEGLKYFFEGAMVRDSFVGFMAAMKRGKTFWQIDLAWRAMRQGRRVAFFEIGDMSQNQIMRRFAVRAAKQPLKPTRPDKPILYPVFIETDGNGKKATVTHKKWEFPAALDYATARAAMKRVTGDSAGPETKLRLSVHPTVSINVPGVANVLDGWERVGWVPDIVVIDYADLLAPINAKEPLHAIDETWAALRGLSQSRHCLVVTATQANAQSFRAETLNETHFAGNKLKFAHVTGMVGISATPAEKAVGLSRVNWLVRREGEFDTDKVCHCAGCLAVAAPAVKSIF